jgi:hypothetical protein
LRHSPLYHHRLQIVRMASNRLVHHIGTLTVDEGSQPILGVVFDMDGTLIHEAIDYAAMRAALGIPYPGDVILEIKSMTDVSRQQEYVIFIAPNLLMVFTTCLAFNPSNIYNLIY